LAGVREVSGDTPLVGATTSGHFHQGNVTAPGSGVAVLALSRGRYRFGVASVTGITSDATGAGRTLARAAKRAAGQEGPYAALLVVGGSAADDRALKQTHVFHGGRVLTDAAVGVWIASPWPLTVTSGHGWTPVSLPLLVTKVDGPVVHEIAGRPAEAVFREHFCDHQLDRELGWVRKPGYHSAHAFGLIEPDGSLVIRGAYLDESDVLRTFSPLPTYAPVQIVSSTSDDLLGVIEDVVARVTAGRQPSVV